MSLRVGTDGKRDVDFLAGGGEMGRIMRQHDWSSSQLGQPTEWPQALRTTVRLLLNTGHPMYIWWGPDLICLYNDAYSRSIGPDRHAWIPVVADSPRGREARAAALCPGSPRSRPSRGPA